MKNSKPIVRRTHRGVVLITVVLVLLVLSVLGLAAAVLMTQEDRSSSRAEMQRLAFYVAETGLRRGEGILGSLVYSNVTLSTMLARTTTTECAATTPKLPAVPPGWGVDHLGTYLLTEATTGTEIANIEVTNQFGLSGTQRALYSLYVRNNEGEASATVNIDTKIRLVAVGWVADPNGNPLSVKVLEEEFDYSSLTMNQTLQKQVDFGGTGAGVFGG